MRAFALIAATLFASASMALEVESLRLWPAPDNTRIVLDLSGPVRYHVFRMTAPDRVVVDLQGAAAPRRLPPAPSASQQVAGIRGARRNSHDYRVVFDLKRAVEVRDSLLPPNGEYGHRLVIDLVDKGRPAPSPSSRSSPGALPEPATLVDLPAPPLAPERAVPPDDDTRPIVVAIDPGHGGEDPGALGRRGTREKDVVLQMARRLAKLINAERGMRAVLTRDGDYYVGLRERMRKARAHKADLFVSIHADAFRNASVKGSSVYVLSQRGASSEAARWLAERENAADLVGGVTLDDKDDVLKSVLLDLSQTAAMEASINVADRVLRELRGVGQVHRKSVQYAGFMVLKSPDVPSILVETAFISNPNEEQRLRNEQYQNRIARAVLAGIRSYFREYPPPGTVLAARTHEIAAGETLGAIASRYSVSAEQLRLANDLHDDRVRAGATLTIP